MNSDDSTTAHVRRYLNRLADGDLAARAPLLEHAQERLTRLARKLLSQFPQVRRWEQTEDVFQGASIRLCRALEETQPVDPLHFFRLAAVQIRRELIDLARRYQGPQGLGANHASARIVTADDDGSRVNQYEAMDATNDPQRLVQWAEFHRLVDRLPEEQREVFDLIWYQGLSQEEAAKLLAVTTRTVKRRWRTARLAMHDLLGESPDD